MNFNELYELENYEGSGFSNFLKDQSKKFIKNAASSAVEKAVNIGGEKVGEKAGTTVGELIANKIIPTKKSQNTEIPIDSGYKIIKILQKNPVDNIRTQFNSIN